MAADRSIVVRLRAEIAQFKQEMGEAGAAVGRVADRADDVGRRGAKGFGDVLTWVNKNEQALSTLSTGVGLVGVGLTSFAALAVKRFADFDQAMSGVASTSDDARANITRLRDAALDAGANTVFSATEAAGAIEELAKAGLSAADILDGGLNGALDLAAAGSLDVAEAAGYTAVALQQFRLRGDQAAHVADLLAAGAGKAMGDVSDLGQALAQSGLVASQTGLSLEETTGALAAFAQAGLLGSDAGTSLKTMLQRLTPQSDEAARQLEQLGISAYDANGQFVGLENFAGQLQERMATLSPEARNAAMSVMFGSDAVRAATVLYDQGAEGIRGWTQAVDDQGYAAEVAATKLDNLKGDVEGLMGSIDTALINMGEGANGPLRDLVQGLDSIVDRFNALPAPVQQATLLIAGGSGLALLGVAALGKLLIALAEAQAAVKTLGITAGLAKVQMFALGTAVPVLAVAAGATALAQWGANASTARVNTDELQAALARLNGTRVGGALADLFTNTQTLDFLPWVRQIETADDAVKAFGASAREALGDQFWDRLDRRLDFAGEELEKFRGQTEQMDAAFAQLVQSGNVDGATQAFERFMDAAEAQGVPLDELRKMFPQYAEALQVARQGNEELAPAVDLAAQAAEQQAAATQEANDALAEWMEQVAGADASFIDLTGGYQAIIDKNREWAESAAAATTSSEDSWNDFYDGFTVSTAEYIAELERQAAAQQSWEANMLLLSGRVSQGVIDELARLGPEGAPLVAQLVNASDEELARLEAVYGQRSTEATNAFADNLRRAAPVLAAIMDRAGVDAANAAAAKLASGEMTLQQVIDAYDLDFIVDADTGAAVSAVQALFRQYDNKSMTVYIDAVTRGGTGGGNMLAQADGGIVKFFGDGGHNENHVAQIARAGDWRVWAEPETGGESYIPHAPAKRRRSLDIWAQTGRILGVPGFAAGDVVRGAVYAAPARAQGGSGGGGDVHFHIGRVSTRDSADALARALITRGRDVVATHGLAALGAGGTTL